jgi:hypothetical protein
MKADQWQERLEDAVAAYTLKRTKRNRIRMELAERRAYGVMVRQAVKLARNRR